MIDKTVKKIHKKIYENIKQQIKLKKITQTKIAKELGITSATLSEQLKNLSEGKSISTDKLFRIACILDIEITELFK